MKGLLALAIALAVATVPAMVLADDGMPPGDQTFYDLLKNPLALRDFILSPAGLALAGSLSSLILREIPAFVALESKRKRLISAGAAVVTALALYGLSFVPEDVWQDLGFLWYAVLGYGLIYFGQKFTYRLAIKPEEAAEDGGVTSVVFEETGPGN